MRDATALEGLRDEREVWYQGEKMADVTAHPARGRLADSGEDR